MEPTGRNWSQIIEEVRNGNAAFEQMLDGYEQMQALLEKLLLISQTNTAVLRKDKDLLRLQLEAIRQVRAMKCNDSLLPSSLLLRSLPPSCATCKEAEEVLQQLAQIAEVISDASHVYDQGAQWLDVMHLPAPMPEILTGPLAAIVPLPTFSSGSTGGEDAGQRAALPPESMHTRLVPAPKFQLCMGKIGFGALGHEGSNASTTSSFSSTSTPVLRTLGRLAVQQPWQAAAEVPEASVAEASSEQWRVDTAGHGSGHGSNSDYFWSL